MIFICSERGCARRLYGANFPPIPFCIVRYQDLILGCCACVISTYCTTQIPVPLGRLLTMAEIGDTRKTSNECEVAKRVLRTDAGCFLSSNYIAAIDFGTTNCSVAYILPGKMSEKGPVMLPFDGTVYRVPNAILFDDRGKVVAFGKNARRTYSGLEDYEKLEYSMFEHIKMDLQHEEVSKQFYLRLVF